MERRLDYITSEEFIKTIKSLDDDFVVHSTAFPDRLVLHWRDKYISGFSKSPLPRHDELDYTGGVKKRGYQHIIKIIYEVNKRGQIVLNVNAASKIGNLVQILQIYDDPQNYKNPMTDEQRDIEKTEYELHSKYGVKVGFGKNLYKEER